MSSTNDTLEFVQIVGPGVTALDNRKEHNNNKQVTVEDLRASINKVKARNFAALKALAVAATSLAR